MTVCIPFKRKLISTKLNICISTFLRYNRLYTVFSPITIQEKRFIYFGLITFSFFVINISSWSCMQLTARQIRVSRGIIILLQKCNPLIFAALKIYILLYCNLGRMKNLLQSRTLYKRDSQVNQRQSVGTDGMDVFTREIDGRQLKNKVTDFKEHLAGKCGDNDSADMFWEG